ncbi:hypothetical protein SDC9_203457 [bioreactor metagenome]|uniref:Uncharacterized protein n=1 Tax=bioreactor metagenome TaxID=1076179 RepID=A0A645J8G1_9ZZZZ
MREVEYISQYKIQQAEVFGEYPIEQDRCQRERHNNRHENARLEHSALAFVIEYEQGEQQGGQHGGHEIEECEHEGVLHGEQKRLVGEAGDIVLQSYECRCKVINEIIIGEAIPE